MEDKKLVIVDCEALPDIFLKVLHAKELLLDGTASSASEAARISGLSRSAYYKYKDSVFPYNKRSANSIISLHAVLKDKAGVLSQLLSQFHKSGANILTVNQGIPSNGVAPVSISFRTERMNIAVDELISEIKQMKGIVSIKQILGE